MVLLGDVNYLLSKLTIFKKCTSTRVSQNIHFTHAECCNTVSMWPAWLAPVEPTSIERCLAGYLIRKEHSLGEQTEAAATSRHKKSNLQDKSGQVSPKLFVPADDFQCFWLFNRS